jgi:hypothetical protein
MNKLGKFVKMQVKFTKNLNKTGYFTETLLI